LIVLDCNFAFLVCGSEVWSVPLWEEDRLIVFENTVLRGIFVFKGAQVTGDRRRLYNEEHHNFYS